MHIRTPAALAGRRVAFGLLVLATAAAALAVLVHILRADGAIDGFDAAMLALFALTLPWNMIGFWNAIIGLGLALFARDPVTAVCPSAGLDDGASAPLGQTALLMAIHEEEPGPVFERLRATLRSLEATGHAGAFTLFVLSDTQTPSIAALEEEGYRALKAGAMLPDLVRYRRRTTNQDHKTGNLWDWLERHGAGYDQFLLLDADSVMSGEAILRLRRIMDCDPRLGILQSLVVGLPAASAFTRLFQFGMRHGLRTYTLGSAWWQGDAGPYWGHNAILRTEPFVRHCRLPRLPGARPLGGMVLSHDQVEAALMRGAGHHVRVLPVEHGSFEANPPTLPDFVKRDLRWCQGNMQYLRLLDMPGLLPMGRLQLALAILMYAAAPAWLGFMAVGLAKAVAIHAGWIEIGEGFSGPAVAFAVALLLGMLALSLTPKLAGYAQALLDRRMRKSLGGTGRLLASAGLETVFALLLSPIVAVAQGVFIVGLAFKHRVGWGAQRRTGRAVGWGEALRYYWPQTLSGIGMTAALAVAAPGALPWAAPVLAALLLAVPFARLTSTPALGRALVRLGLAATPEEGASVEPLTWLDDAVPPFEALPARRRARFSRRRGSAASESA